MTLDRIIFIGFIFTISFFSSCEESSYTPEEQAIISNLQELGVDEPGLEIVKTIIEKDVEKIAELFLDELYFMDLNEDEMFFTVYSESGYLGFRDGNGELYALIWDTEKFLLYNEGENNFGDFELFLQDPISVYDAMFVADEFNFVVYERGISKIEIVLSNSDYRIIRIKYETESGKIVSVSYL